MIERDLDLLVDELAVAHRAKAAARVLRAAGAEATPAVRRGLRHDDPVVVVACCDILDHCLDEAALPELFACLHHDNAKVRARALHALACDKCKEGVCRPGESAVVEAAVLAFGDRVAEVRVAAVAALGPAVRRSEVAFVALEERARNDADPVVRKTARWYLPGGRSMKVAGRSPVACVAERVAAFDRGGF